MRHVVGAMVCVVIIALALASVISHEISRPTVRIIDLDGNSLSYSVNGNLKVSCFNSEIEARNFADYLTLVGKAEK